jgi:WD40 repeat protein
MHNSFILETLPRVPTRAPQVDPEALIEEARGRQRRRRARLAAAILVLVTAGGVAYLIVRSTSGGAAAIEHTPNGPVVNVAGFAHHGKLAFVSHNRLWVLDGETGSVRSLPTPGPQRPVFSADGRWLAYLEQNNISPRLWLAHSDGTGAHVVRGLKVYSLYGWSPASDVLAVATGPERTRQPCPCSAPTTVRLISPDGRARRIARVPWVYGAAWSPGGDALAVGRIAQRTSVLASYPVAGGWPTVWLSIPARKTLNGMNGAIVSVAGWWPRFGLGIWVFGEGMVHNNDETPLDAIATPHAGPRLLGQTLSDGATDVVAASSKGLVAIVTDHGGGRAAWQDKQLELCTPTSPCTPMASARGDVTLDPAWSPNGKTLAYVEAPNVRTGPWTQKALAAWFAAHRVFLYDVATRRAHELIAARGATAITWSRDGRGLLYVRDDALWLLPSLTGKPVRIAAPLFAGRWPQYFAQVDWSAQFAWSSR